MTTVGSSKAQAHLSRLLDRVSKGESVTITRYGRPVAMLVPVSRESTRDPQEVIRELIEFRKGHSLGGLSIRDMVAEGRRF
jgi:prevent-host-death family protein